MKAPSSVASLIQQSLSLKRPHSGLRPKPRMWVPPTPVPVSSDEDYDSDSSLEDEEYLLRSPKRQRTCRVRFSRHPVLHEIPSHKSYTPEEKEQIWNSRSCLKKMNRRNRKEWAWESRNGIVEEDAFWVNQDGERIHPAHRSTAASQC